MSKSLHRLFLLAGVAIGVYFLISLFANLSQLADAADRVYAGSGRPLFLTLAAVSVVALLAPLFYYFSLPRPLIPPAETSGPVHDAYLARLAIELNANPHVAAVRKDEPHWEIDAAIAHLDMRAKQVIAEHARTVFIGTTLMQSGRLDGLVVLATQARMVWRIAHVYYRRPSPRQFLYLYSNVAASALIAENIADIDLGEITAPIVAAATPSLVGAVPGMQAASNLLVNSLANGAANAFLTLRVGLVARGYCRAQAMPGRAEIRRRATLDALVMFGEIVQSNAGQIAGAVWQRIGGTAAQIARSAGKGVVSAATSTAEGIADATNAAVASIKSALEVTGKQLKDLAEKAVRLKGS
ncbi:MAG: DUF697 domain-containing protein [Pseudomonadota bacterium]